MFFLWQILLKPSGKIININFSIKTTITCKNNYISFKILSKQTTERDVAENPIKSSFNKINYEKTIINDSGNCKCS